jgi:hypothetical protein
VCHAGKGDLAMPDKMSDRRVASRYPIILKAELTELSGGAKLIGRTSDISRTGCYIDTFQPYRSGAAIHIRLTRGTESFEVQGTVRYVSTGLGMGIQFEAQVPVKELAILDRWLEAAARQPA